MKKEFSYVFQQSRMVVFEVEYQTLGDNPRPYFSTSAARFNQPKTDFAYCGQCQNELLTGKLRRFYKKWNHLHIRDLSDEEYTEILEDLEDLKREYNYLERISDYRVRSFSFDAEKRLSMIKVKS